MEIYCTRPTCPDPVNSLPTFENISAFKAGQQRFCGACSMPLILDGRYLPLSRMGGGSFGTTFLAVDLRSATKRQCIIKQLRLQNVHILEQIEGVKRAFRREAEILEILGHNHSQIPSLYAYCDLTVPVFRESSTSYTDSNALEELFYLVLEYIEGQDLNKELEQKGRFSEAEVLEVLHQTLPVIQYIHEYKAIHRDIKPSNIMRDRNGRIYLIDFGAVKQIAAGVPMQNSLVFGTQGFSPPEQVAGRQVYPSSDLYALAATALCLLTGRSPQTLLSADGDSWNWHQYVQVSDRLENILDRMLNHLPSQRFPSAQDVIAAFSQETQEIHESSHQQSIVQTPSAQSTLIPPYSEVSRQTTHLPQSTATPSELQLSELLKQAAVLGSGSWLLATLLVSFLGTLLAPGFWLLILGGLIFKGFAKQFSTPERTRLLLFSIVSVGATFFLAPQFFATFAFTQALPQIFLLAIVAGLFKFILLTIFQFVQFRRNSN